jgi:DNA-binding NarL/FixJ family response regulator
LVFEVNISESSLAIFAVLNGESYIQPNLIPELNSYLIHKDDDKIKLESLTKREVEVLIEVAKGNFNKDIALHLNISERTVKNHMVSIFKKIEVADRTQAAVFAIKNNLIKI